MVIKSHSVYWDALDEAIDAEREAYGQKPLKPKAREAEIRESTISRTDPDSGYVVRDGKPQGFGTIRNFVRGGACRERR
jgi:hypothetical protein